MPGTLASVRRSGAATTASRLIGCLLVLPGLLLAAEGCGRRLQQTHMVPGTPPRIAELWQEPVDFEQRDLFYGAGGAKVAPVGRRFEFVARDTSGRSPGFDVKDANAVEWSVKLGAEAQSEVVTSRILWAIGFHQPPTYYVERWTLSGADIAEQPAGRFRTESPGHEVAGDWSWYDNPFIGSPPFGALVTVNVLLNNWDLKTTNNKIYVVTSDDGGKEPRYVVRDLGASFGKARQPRFLSWFPFMRHKQGSKNTLADFEAQGFVKGFQGENVQFDYRGIDDALVNSPTMADLRWTGELLSRLSDRQWQDAFRAGGYTPDQSERYVRKIKEKIAQAVAQPR